MKPTESSKKAISRFFETNCKENPFGILKKVRANNVNRVLIGHLNITFIKNKFDTWHVKI